MPKNENDLEADENLTRYLDLVRRIYERISQDPKQRAALQRFLKSKAKRRKPHKT